MAARDREGEERGERFVNLLQPSRDLAANWTVDVGKELENYLAELYRTGLFEDGQTSLNFAEAALLIQGSIQIYSRKVEYLYALVIKALDFISEKRQGQQEKSSQQSNSSGNDEDIADAEEEEFLNLDDVPEEANIDMDDQGIGASSVKLATKVPASLLIAEADATDLSGEVGELSTYQIATSTMHRDFLLLDPCDAESVDIYLRDNGDGKEGRTGANNPFSNAPRSKTPKGNFSTPRRAVGSAQKPGVVGTPVELASARNADSEDFDDDNDDWHGVDGEGGAIENDPSVHMEQAAEGVRDGWGGMPGGENGYAEAEKDDYIDPWIPLNPHETGTLPIRPYKRGQTQRKKPRQRRERSGPEFPIASRTGVCFPEFAKALQARERQARAERRQNGLEFVPFFENLRSSFWSSDAEQPDDISDHHGGRDILEDPEMDDENDWDDPSAPTDFDEDNVTHPGPSEVPDTINGDFHVPENGPNFDNGVGEGLSLEELCRVQMDDMLQKLAEQRVQSGLATRVASWKQNIEATLREQDSRPPFDIHADGDRLLNNLSAASKDGEDEVPGHKTFTQLVRGQQKEQVARSFSALLQLVNNGNVILDRGKMQGTSTCFTAQNPFSVHLLTTQSRHEELLKKMGSTTDFRSSCRTPATKTKVATTDEHLEAAEVAAIPEIYLVSSPTSLKSPGVTKSGRVTPMSKSPSSVRRSSRKRRQGVNGRVGRLDIENRVVITPVKLTPERTKQRQRRSLQTIQV